MLPPLQPTQMSIGMPSRCSTFHMPTAAAHFMPPEPTTTASRGRPRGATCGVPGGSATCSGIRLLQHPVLVVELRLGGAHALLDHVRELVGVELSDHASELCNTPVYHALVR